MFGAITPDAVHFREKYESNMKKTSHMYVVSDSYFYLIFQYIVPYCLNDKEEKMRELIEKIENTASGNDFSGVVSICRGREIIYDKGFGYRDIKNKMPNNTDTVFGIASGTKFFTALGIGVLIDQGKLSLESKMEELFPENTGFIDEKATVLHLLTHTSGIFDYYDEEKEQDYDNFTVEIPWCKLETPGDYYPLFKNEKMKFKAGERYSYSNGGYVFLGILIEKITGKLYRDFITEYVLKPANMKNSGFFAFNCLPANTANGYFEDRTTTNIFQLPIRGGGDGGMYTNSEDLLNLWNNLFSNKILSPELTKIYLEAHHDFGDGFGYGCGMYKKQDNSAFFITGGDAGVGFFSRHLPSEKITINVFSNITNGEEEIVDTLLDNLNLLR